MALQPSSATARIERVVSEIFRLRHIIAQSTFDDDLVLRRKIRVRHVVDTPIFSLYAQPKKFSHWVAAIPSLTATDLTDVTALEEGLPPRFSSKTEQNALRANALLTGEYIFSLGAQGASPSVLVAPEHLGEIFGYVSSLEANAKEVYTRNSSHLGDVFATGRHRLTGQQRALEARLITPAQWVAAVRDIVDGMAEDAGADVLAHYRLRRLFEQDRVANAADDPEFAPYIAPAFHDIQEWKRRIHAAKLGNRISPNPHALEADAITLAQLAKINATWERDKRVFVLITSDIGLHRAYSSWVSEERRRRLPTFYALRDPRQYVPILNVRDMQGRYVEPEIFRDVRSAIATFIASFTSSDFESAASDPVDPTVLPSREMIRRVIGERISNPGKNLELFTEQIDAQIQEIGDRWVEAIETSIVAKTDVLAELSQEHARIWTAPDALNNLDQMFKGRVRAMGSGFEKLAGSAAWLRQEVSAIESGLEREGLVEGHNRRSIASTFSAFNSPTFKGRTLREIATFLSERREQAIPILADVDRTERLLFAGSLSLEIGAWAAAKMLLTRALAAAPEDSPIKREARFYTCVARRLAASRTDFIDEYKEARAELRLLAKTVDRRDEIDSARLLNERFALELCEVAYRADAKNVLGRYVQQAIGFWKRVMASRQRDAVDLEDENWQYLARQFLLNTFNLLFWANVAGISDIEDIKAASRDGLAMLLHPAAATIGDRPSGKVYPLLAQYALSEPGPGREETGRLIVDVITGIQAWDAQSGFAFDLPLVDKAEFDEILRLVNLARTDRG